MTNNDLKELEQKLISTFISDIELRKKYYNYLKYFINYKSVAKIINELCDENIETTSTEILLSVKNDIDCQASGIKITDLVGGGLFLFESEFSFAVETLKKEFISNLFKSKLADIISKNIDNSNISTISSEVKDIADNVINECQVLRDYNNADILHEVFERIEDLMNNDTDVIGLSTGFKQLDKITKGFQKQKLYILAARPAMGKTALSLQLFYNMIIKGNTKNNRRGIFFSLEMGKTELMQRLVNSITGVNTTEKEELLNVDFNEITSNTFELANDNFIIYDNIFDIDNIIATARSEHAKEKLDFLAVDYLQIISSNRKMNNREAEISMISRKLKLLSKELNVPILALAQLSRAVESRADKMPLLSDLRDSGAIEQDADVVMFLFRPSYYGINTDENGLPIPDGYTLLPIAKNRGGGLGSVKLEFQKSITKFVDYEETTLTQNQNFSTEMYNNNNMKPNDDFIDDI